jgi:hypothetical protein
MLRPQVLDQLAHWIGDGFNALELKDVLVYPLDFVGHYDPTVEDAGLIGAALFGHSVCCRHIDNRKSTLIFQLLPIGPMPRQAGTPDAWGDAEPMSKSLIIAIIASLVSTLVNAKPYMQRRAKAQPRAQIACTVVGCSPVPRGCVPRPGRTWSGLPSGFDVIVCPPGAGPVR